MDSPKPSLSTRDITFTAVGIALISVSAWVTVPIGPVPFTLQTMALAFVLVAMSPVQSTLAVMLYLVLGAAGLPLFSGMRGGVGVLLSPTGGFLIGFALAALAALVIRRVMDDSPARDVVVVVALIVCSYFFGWAWLMVSTGMSATAAFAAACLPFIVPDIIKCAVGITMARAVRRAVPNLA